MGKKEERKKGTLGNGTFTKRVKIRGKGKRKGIGMLGIGTVTKRVKIRGKKMEKREQSNINTTILSRLYI
jgi:hypothetical protein